jgi:hypothetical protein
LARPVSSDVRVAQDVFGRFTDDVDNKSLLAYKLKVD